MDGGKIVGWGSGFPYCRYWRSRVKGERGGTEGRLGAG